MRSNSKANSQHRNLMKFALAIKMDRQGAAKYANPTITQGVQRMAARVAPLIRSVDNNERVVKARTLADLANRNTKNAFRRLQQGVLFWFGQRIPELEDLGRLRLGADPSENVIRLQALVRGLAGQMSFPYPPDLQPQDLENIMATHDETFRELVAAEKEVVGAARELLRLRPEVEQFWEGHNLTPWIQANIVGHDEQLAWGMPTKRQVKRKKEAAKKPAATGQTSNTSSTNDAGKGATSKEPTNAENKAKPAVAPIHTLVVAPANTATAEDDAA